MIRSYDIKMLMGLKGRSCERKRKVEPIITPALPCR
jgi:hypothetical protein